MTTDRDYMTGQKRGQPHWRRVIKIELRVLSRRWWVAVATCQGTRAWVRKNERMKAKSYVRMCRDSDEERG